MNNLFLGTDDVPAFFCLYCSRDFRMGRMHLFSFSKKLYIRFLAYLYLLLIDSIHFP